MGERDMPQVMQWKQNSSFALKHSAFRLYLLGNLPNRIGEWMDFVALNWAVLQFSGSPLLLGIVNACRLVPIFLFSLPGGILADRYNRRFLLIGAQATIMLFTFILAYFIDNGAQMKWVLIAVTLRSIFMALETSIRNSYIPNLVPSFSLSSAIALHTAGLHIGRIIGPAVAGWLLAYIEISALFVLYGFTLFGSILSLLLLKGDVSAERKKQVKSSSQIGEGLRYIKETPIVQSLLVLAIIPMIFGFPYSSVIPLFVQELMEKGPEGFAMLLSISSIGALLGTIWLSVFHINSIGKWLISSVFGFGGTLLIFMFVTDHLLLASAAMFFIGITGQVYRTLSRTSLQMNVPDHLRGRIMSIALMDRGFIPLGTIMITLIAEQFGVVTAGIIMGAGCAVCPLLVLLQRKELWKI
jgi:MFS transporter, DHA1 family, staphyloferrin A biosynthesis exporter